MGQGSQGGKQNKGTQDRAEGEKGRREGGGQRAGKGGPDGGRRRDRRSLRVLRGPREGEGTREWEQRVSGVEEKMLFYLNFKKIYKILCLL